MKTLAFFAIYLTVFASASPAQLEFDPVSVSQGIGGVCERVLIGDFTNDGLTDVVCNFGETIKVYVGNDEFGLWNRSLPCKARKSAP